MTMWTPTSSYLSTDGCWVIWQPLLHYIGQRRQNLRTRIYPQPKCANILAKFGFSLPAQAQSFHEGPVTNNWQSHTRSMCASLLPDISCQSPEKPPGNHGHGVLAQRRSQTSCYTKSPYVLGRGFGTMQQPIYNTSKLLIFHQQEQ